MFALGQALGAVGNGSADCVAVPGRGLGGRRRLRCPVGRRGRSGALGGFLGGGIDLGEGGADQHRVALAGEHGFHQARGGGGHLDVDLIGRDVDEGGALLDPLPRFDAPFDDGALGHRLAHFGQGDAHDGFRHARAPCTARYPHSKAADGPRLPPRSCPRPKTGLLQVAAGHVRGGFGRRFVHVDGKRTVQQRIDGHVERRHRVAVEHRGEAVRRLGR